MGTYCHKKTRGTRVACKDEQVVIASSKRQILATHHHPQSPLHFRQQSAGPGNQNRCHPSPHLPKDRSAHTHTHTHTHAHTHTQAHAYIHIFCTYMQQTQTKTQTHTHIFFNTHCMYTDTHNQTQVHMQRIGSELSVFGGSTSGMGMQAVATSRYMEIPQCRSKRSGRKDMCARDWESGTGLCPVTAHGVGTHKRVFGSNHQHGLPGIWIIDTLVDDCSGFQWD